MGLYKTGDRLAVSAAEWNREEAIRYIRNKVVVRIAEMIISCAAVSVALYILNNMGIIKL